MKENPTTTTHDSLQDAFVKFAQDVLKLAKQWPEAKDVPFVENYHVVFEGRSWREKTVRTRQYWYLFRNCIDDEIVPLESAETCAKNHFEAGIIKPPRRSGKPIQAPAFDQIKRKIIREILSPVVDVLSLYGTFDPTPEQILESYKRFRRLWDSDIETFVFTAPLVNFSTTFDCVEVCEGWSIVRFLDDEKTALWNIGFHEHSEFDMIGFAPFRDSSFCLRSIQTFPVGEGRNYSAAAQRVSEVITAFRLLKAGDVGAPCTYAMPKDQLSKSGPAASALENSSVRRFGSTKTFSLCESDLKEFRVLYGELEDFKERGTLRFLEMALRRFNFAYQREDMSDQIIDLTIVLESSLLRDNPQELRYRLALRGAALLVSEEDPAEIFKTLRSMYDVRSGIVHSGLSLEDEGKLAKALGNKRPAEFVNECMDTTRMILRAYVKRLASGNSAEEITKDLDNKIISSLKKGQ